MKLVTLDNKGRDVKVQELGYTILSGGKDRGKFHVSLPIGRKTRRYILLFEPHELVAEVIRRLILQSFPEED